MASQKKKPVALNPNAPEFYPTQSIPPKPMFIYVTPITSSFNNGFLPYYSYSNYTLPHYKPAKKSNSKTSRFQFGNKKLPPRLLKNKVCVQKNHNLSTVKFKDLHDNKSSIMIKNIPNSFGRNDLIGILDAHCREENREAGGQETRSSYDFLYLPMDFVKHANLGYAFVNFTSSVAAEKFRKHFDNFFWTTLGNKKYCQISIAKIQGKEKLSKHFKESRFTCHTDEYLPVVLSPPSDGFTRYSLMTVGYRVDAHRGAGGFRRGQVV